MKQVAIVLFVTILGSFAQARDYASTEACKNAERFLQRAPAVAIVGGDFFFDGGSLQFTFQSNSGERFNFLLSVYSQRRAPDKFLSLYEGLNIKLVQDAYYDPLCTRLRDALSAGIVTGLQKHWADFSPEADALIQLLVRPGTEHDLDSLYKLGTARMKAAHDALVASRANNKN